MIRESLRVLLLMFWLGTSSQNLHKIAKNTSVCPEEDKYSDINIYSDALLIMGQAKEKNSHVQRQILILQQHLGFVLNLKKSILSPVQEIEFLGVTINSLKMFLSLPQKKVLKIQSQCQDVYAKGQVTVHELTELLSVLASMFDIFSNSK